MVRVERAGMKVEIQYSSEIGRRDARSEVREITTLEELISIYEEKSKEFDLIPGHRWSVMEGLILKRHFDGEWSIEVYDCWRE